jgi:phosphohistidine phosphatase
LSLKILHLMRHAKSAWDQPGLADYERALNKRGKRDAPRMGAALSASLKPLGVHVSSARRARHTLRGICDGWPQLAAIEHHTEERLYTFSSDQLSQWIRAQDDALAELFIISHNPGLTDLVNLLLGQHSLDNLPTAGYVQLALQIDHWNDMLQGCALLQCSLFPKQLESR